MKTDQIASFWDSETIRWCKMQRRNQDLSLLQLWSSFEIPDELKTVESLIHLAKQLEVRIDADDSEFKSALFSVAPTPQHAWHSPNGRKALKAIKEAVAHA